MAEQPTLPSSPGILRPLRQVRRLVPADARNLAALRSFVDEITVRWECCGVAEDAKAVSNELVSNALRHARSNAMVRLDLRHREFVIAVEDQDPTRPALRRPDPADTMPTSGLGLLIVDALSVRWGSFPSGAGKIVWAAIATSSGR